MPYSSGVKRDPQPQREQEERKNRRARGTGLDNREPFEIPAFLQGRQIGRGTGVTRSSESSKDPKQNINPRTGKPYSETPGKSPTEAGATLVPSSAPKSEVITDSETRENSNGMVQTGRNLGYRTNFTDQGDGTPYLEGAGGLFARLGLGDNVKINRQWSSNQLPGTDTSPYQGSPVSKELGEGEQQVQLSKDLQSDGGAVRNLEGMPLEAFEASQKSGGSGESGGESEGGQRNWMKPREMDAKMARRAAFLDAPNSMAGMRAVDAQLGRVRAGGDYYYANPNAGSEGASDFIKVSTETGRKHQNDQISGQQLLNMHLEKVKGDMSVDPASNTNPADYPADSEFSPDMTEEQFVDFQNRGGSKRSLEDMTEEDFINYQN